MTSFLRVDLQLNGSDWEKKNNDNTCTFFLYLLNNFFFLNKVLKMVIKSRFIRLKTM